MESTFLITCAAGWEREAREEVHRTLPGAHVEQLFLRGVLLARVPMGRREALNRLAQARTDLLNRVVPVVGELKVGETEESVEEVARGCVGLVTMRRGERFVVRARRRGTHRFTSTQLKQAVARALEEATGAVGDYLSERPDWVVQLEVLQDRVFVGWGRPEEFLHKRAGSRPRYGPGERPVSRAQHKIREAVERFSIPLGADWRVLDLGSAPGGWVAWLAGRVAEVVAVDPADLAPQVRGLGNVRHCRQRAEDFLREYGGEPFHFLTNDMNVEPELSARLMVQAARLLVPEGWALMTVKYTSRRRREHRERVAGLLRDAYEGIRFARLPHNRREVTVVMRRRAGGFSFDAGQ